MNTTLDVKFNPSLGDLLQQAGPKIAFVHIGKTAGTTIQCALKCNLRDTHFALYEYHCFDCNTRIADLVYGLVDKSDISIVIPVRDPLERWVSAYNWDFSRMSADEEFLVSHPEYKESLALFTSCSKLIDGLEGGRADAELLAGYGHLCMGHAWYLPPAITRMINPCQLHVISFDHLEQDVLMAINAIRASYGFACLDSISLPNEKTNYKPFFPNFSFAKMASLSPRQISFMREKYLANDYLAISSLPLRSS